MKKMTTHIGSTCFETRVNEAHLAEVWRVRRARNLPTPNSHVMFAFGAKKREDGGEGEAHV